MGNTIEVVFTILGLSFWILFTIGMFLSIGHLEQVHDAVEDYKPQPPVYTANHFDWHHPVIHFKRWLHHE